MESKSKKFTRKLIALILSVLMAASCFTGAITAFAADEKAREYHDSNIIANFMAWAETTNEQSAEALLDWADDNMEGLFSGLLGGTSHINFSLSILGTIDGYLDSVDGLLDITNSDAVKSILNTASSFKALVGDLGYIDLSPLQGMSSTTSGDVVISKCGRSFRANYSAKEILMRVAQVLYNNSNTFATNNKERNLIGKFLRGTLSMGSIIENNLLHGTVYSLLQGALGADDGYESNLVYNLVRSLIFNNTKWYSDSDIAAYKNGSKTWNYDDQLFGKLSTELISEINVLVTYPTEVETVDKETGKTIRVKDNSGLRKEKIDAYIEAHGCDYKTAANALGYDSNLVYHVPSNDEGKDFANNINIFQYGNEKLSISKDDTLFSFAYKALAIAWKSVLKPTLGLVNVDNDVDRGNGKNFDNNFYRWMYAEGKWNESNWKSNYTEANIRAWAEAMYTDKDYKCASPDEFIANARHTLEYDRTVADDAKGNWQDIDSTKLFGKLRYSPLADLYFDMQTGPINLYFRETGIDPIEKFFAEDYTKYDNIVAGFNDCLVAAVELIFPDSKNIGIQGAEQDVVATNLTRPTMQKTGNTTDIDTITNTLISNALAMVEYVANTTDSNILNPYYESKGISTVSGNLKEENLEEAMLPLLISCLQNVDMVDPIHDEKWDACKDAEGVAVVALEEYLSYVLPDKDYSSLWSYDANGQINATFDGTLMPMARDALGFIICPIVPVRTLSDKKEWNVYTSPVDSNIDIFDLLNSVVVYYAGTETFADGSTGKGVASLLGMVDKNGNCLIKSSNTLWENLDVVVNSLLPVVGQLQYGTKGSKASSYDLIYNKIIKGFLDIGPNKGVSNFLKQFLTICVSDPIAKTGLDVMVYDDLLVPFANSLFGARYEGQGYDKVIPYSSYYDNDPYSTTSSASPFDSLVQVDTIGKYSAQNDKDDGNQTGVLGILICNVYEALGGGSYGTSAAAGVKGCWDAIGFALTAVNSFIPSFIPQLGQHKLNAATANLDESSESSLTAGDPFTAKTLYINNEAVGLNNYYRTQDGTVVREPRYFMHVQSVNVEKADGSAASNVTIGGLPNNGIVAPEKSAKVSITGKAPNGTETYVFKIVYDLYLGEGSAPAMTAANTIKTGLEATTYMSLSTDKSWRDTTYPRTDSNGIGQFSEAEESAHQLTTQSSGGTDNKMQTIIPKNFIVPLSDPSSIDNLGMRVRNDTSNVSWGDQNKSVDGIVAYPYSGDKYYAVSGTSIATSLTTASGTDKTLAYAAIDTEGNILNYNRVDISADGENWDRGEVAANTTTYDKSDYNTKNMRKGYGLESNEAKNNVTRPHIAWTFQEALEAGVVKGVYRTPAEYNADGSVKSYLYSAVLIEPTTLYIGGETVNSAENSISWSAGTPGLYFATAKKTLKKQSSEYVKFINYDTNIELTAQNYNINVFAYTSKNQTLTAPVHIYIADDTATATLRTTFNSISNEMAPYRYEDFTDEDVFDNMRSAFSTAVAALAVPISENNAANLGSTMISQAKKSKSSSKLGDVAYMPIKTTEGLPPDILAGATKGSNGYWYYNTECTMPIYSNVKLTEANVEDGKDPLGQAVEKNEDGDYCLVNDVDYEQKWIQPSGVATPFQTDDTTKPIKNQYRQISFVYRDANGKKVTSKDTWSYKFAETETIIKPYDGKDYRNQAAQQIDNLNYWVDQCRSFLKADIALEIVNKIANVRKGLNNVNFDVASYENMVKAAQVVEKQVKSEAVVDENGKKVLDENGDQVYNYTTNLSSLQVEEYVRLFEIQFNQRVYSRGYIGDKLEKEIICATNYPYTALSETHVTDTVDVPAVVDKETGEVTIPATTEEVTTYTVKGTANQAAEYGAYSADGTLVNEGEIVYTAESWDNYINALGEAIEVATAKEKTVSKTYDVKKNLQIAENNLEEVVAADTITVSGTVMIATNTDGSNYSVGITGINILVDGAVVGTSAADGSFSIEVPVGTTELTFAGGSTVDRTVTLAGDANVTDAIVPVAICDYNHDGKINAADNITYFASYGAEYNVYCDFNGDGKVNASDNVVYFAFYGQTVSYGALQLK